MVTADEIIDRLKLVPLTIEGGYFRETYSAPLTLAADALPNEYGGDRHASTAIYYLLAAGQRSHWHRVDATEVWHFYAGGPLRLSVQVGDEPTETVTLGPDVPGGQRPQAVVPAGAWQSAEPAAAWTLVGCTVSPGFSFDGFELAPPGWAPVR